MEDVEEFLRKSIDDDFLSKDERRDLRELIGDRRFSSEQISSLTHFTFELAKQHITDGKAQFILDWVRQTTSMFSTPEITVSEAYFSPGEACRKAIIDQITGAVSKINIAVFTISDDSIVNAILTAHRKGRAIRILTDNDKSLDLGSDIMKLQRSGVKLRMDTTPAHMHHKFMVVDDATLLTGSYNWTSSAARVNYENIIVTEDEKLVTLFMKEFEKLWTGTAF